MGGFQELSGVDAVAAIIGIGAIARGAIIGAIREAFSLAAVAVALIVTRLGTVPAAAWLASTAPLELAPWAATILAGATLGIGSLIAVGLLGRALRAGIRAAGLGFFDRVAGGALGAAEGALVIAVGIALATTALGPDHKTLRETETLAAYQAALAWVDSEGLADVAAPPHARRR
jgi:uncharacterized membrane protein required for colicin V production